MTSLRADLSDMEGIISAENEEGSEEFEPVPVKVYKRRWWILFIFAGIGFMQCSIWNTWGPITNSVKKAYPSWTDAEIGLLSMWGVITMMTGLIPFTYLLQKKGLRVSMIVTAGLLAAGSFVRIFTTKEVPFTICAHIGALLNGFAGIIIGCAPSLLSSTWFPPNERTTATGIGCTFNQLGNAGGFFLGPWIVKEPAKSNVSLSLGGEPDITTQLLRQHIRDYMWISAGICIPFFLFVLAYFPDKPRKPPSLTSALDLHLNSVKDDVQSLIRNKNLWLMLIPYSLTIGSNVAWSSVFDINVAPVGITQAEASFVGVYMTFGGVVLALLASRFTDMIFGYIKPTIIVLLIIATAGFAWFLFIMNGYLPFDKTQLYISSVIGASFSYACSPLFFELGVEIAYPVPQGIVGGALTLCWNLTSAVFLIILQLKMKNMIWMNYLLFSQGLVSLFAMLFVKEEYKRSSLDKVANATMVAEDDENEALLGDMFTSTTSRGSNYV